MENMENGSVNHGLCAQPFEIWKLWGVSIIFSEGLRGTRAPLSGNRVNAGIDSGYASMNLL